MSQAALRDLRPSSALYKPMSDPVVMGRSNWLFAASLAAGQRAANVMSLLETARLPLAR